MMHIIARRPAYGSCFGYVTLSHATRLEHYLAAHVVEAARISSWLRRNCDRVALLYEIHVDAAERGHGHGAAMLNEFLREAQQARADIIILVADAEQPQEAGFVLDEWYRSAGFSRVTNTSSGTLMAFPADQAVLLSNHIGTSQLTLLPPSS
jgi:GNAT superfamily N-acetyltransferase